MGKEEVCIICGKSAEFTEHIFPVSLGGRSTNRKIYCGFHNERFGKLAARLQSQLMMMHAALKVAPDRKSDTKSLLFTDGAIRQRMPGDHIDGDRPPPSSMEWGRVSDVDPLKASIHDIAEPWPGATERERWSLSVGRSHNDKNKRPSVKCRIRVRGGGWDFLQSVGYLALTYFAHSFAEEARQSGFDTFKAVLQLELLDDPKRMPKNLIWWDGRDAASVLGVNPVKGGHAVLVGICETTSRAYAYVSFFSCLVFGVDLGRVDHVSEKRNVRTFIDPIAETSVDPVVELRVSQVISRVREQGQSPLETIRPDCAARGILGFQRELPTCHASEVAEHILGQLPTKQWKSEFEGVAVFQGIVEGHGRIVFNLLQEVVKKFSSELADFKGASSLVESLTQVDVTQANGLTPVASQVFQLAILLIAMRMYQAHAKGTLDSHQIVELLYGISGQELILREVIQHFFARFYDGRV